MVLLASYFLNEIILDTVTNYKIDAIIDLFKVIGQKLNVVLNINNLHVVALDIVKFAEKSVNLSLFDMSVPHQYWDFLKDF